MRGELAEEGWAGGRAASVEEMVGKLVRMLQDSGQSGPGLKTQLQNNPGHPLVQTLKRGEGKFGGWSNNRCGQGRLAEGGALTDPAAFVKRLNELLLGMASR